MNGEHLEAFLQKRIVEEYLDHQDLGVDDFIRHCTQIIIPAYVRKKFHRQKTVRRGRTPRWAIIKEHEYALHDRLLDALRDFVPEHYLGVLKRKVVYPFNKALCQYLHQPDNAE